MIFEQGSEVIVMLADQLEDGSVSKTALLVGWLAGWSHCGL
jgi:hypothetical protein